MEKFERKNGNLFLGLNLQEPSKNLLNLLAKKLARYYIGPLLKDIDQIRESGIHQFPFLSTSKVDKPARLSFSCSLDLLLISIKQI